MSNENNGVSHLICALVTFRSQYEAEVLRQQVAALTQEIERLKRGGSAEATPDPSKEGLHVVPDPV